MTCLWAAVIYLDLLFASLPASYLINPGSLQLGIPNYYYRTVNWHLTQLSVGLFVVKDTHQDRVCVMSISLVRHPTEVIEEKKQFTFPWRGEPTSCAYDDLHNSADQRHSHLEVMTAPPSALHLLVSLGASDAMWHWRFKKNEREASRIRQGVCDSIMMGPHTTTLGAG